MTKGIEAPTEPLTVEQELNRVRVARALNRRKFMAGVGMAGLATAGAGVLAACGSNKNTSTVTAAGPSETDVLNFALNLEYLEASFYLYATTGSGLSSTDLGGSPTITLPATVQTTFTDSRVQDIANEIANDEKLHVEFLRNALSSAAVACPNLNLNALGSFNTQVEFLTLARAFEDTGVSAYGGAATLLTAQNLQYAAQILATEAYHASNIRLNIVQEGFTVMPTDSLDVPPTEQHFFTVDSNALSIIRTPSQVLQIVYAAPGMTGVTSGGFFPNGMNGTIKST